MTRVNLESAASAFNSDVARYFLLLVLIYCI